MTILHLLDIESKIGNEHPSASFGEFTLKD